MKREFGDKKRLEAVFTLALFYFVFLGTEYLYDNMMSYVTDARGVVLAESYILGASFLGFVLFPVLDRYISGKNRKVVCFFGTLTEMICVFFIRQHDSYPSVLAGGCILFTVLGISGSAVHYRISVFIDREACLARLIGEAYALGILMQFLNNNLIPDDVTEAVILAAALAVFAVFILRTDVGMPAEEDGAAFVQRHEEYVLKNPLAAEVTLTAAIVGMSCIFSTLNNCVTLVHANGSADIGQWPRLLLGVSGLLAGFLYDIRDRRYMNLIMYCVTMLSTICVVILQFGGSFRAGLIVFYLSAGFFAVFFTTSFMELSRQLPCPRLWAGFGRAANNICAIITGSLSVLLLEKGGMLMVIVTLFLFVVITSALFLYEKCFERRKETEKTGEEEKFELFCDSFSITQREREVLKALLVSDENVQDIAAELSMSRAVLYRHIASLNQKTETKSRIGLMQFYYAWSGK